MYNIKAKQILAERKFQASLHDKKMIVQEPEEKIEPISKEELEAMSEEEKLALTEKWKRIMANRFARRRR